MRCSAEVTTAILTRASLTDTSSFDGGGELVLVLHVRLDGGEGGGAGEGEHDGGKCLEGSINSRGRVVDLQIRKKTV